jgi:hypothetical protein
MIKKFITFLLNFILVVLVIILFGIILLSKTVLNKDYLKNVLKENNFYTRAYSDIKDEFENYTIQSGLELDILDDLVSNEKVTLDINSRLDAIFEKDDAVIDSEMIKEELNSRIEATLKENNRTPTSKEEEAILTYENTITDCYESGILYGKQIHIPSNLLSKYLKYIIIAILIDTFLIIIINRNLKTILNSIGVILLPVGLLILLLKPLLQHRVQNILIMDQKFSNCLIYILNDILEKCFKYGIIMVIIGILFILISSMYFFQKTIEDKNN